jgi:hypothetical protein
MERSVKKYNEVVQTDIPEEISISNPLSPVIRLRGSNSFQEEIRAVALPRKRRQDDDDDLPDRDDPPPQPPPPVSAPDLAIQFPFCLKTLEGLGVKESDIVAALRQALGSRADVRTACVNETTQPIGIWLRPFVNEVDNQARDRGLRRLNIIRRNENMALFINASMIRRQALEVWDAQPKRLNGDGLPDKNGSVHLTSFSLSFESPNRIVTRIDGFDERPWPDASFRLTVTDTLSADGELVHCDTETDLDVDTGWISFLAGFFGLVLPVVGVIFITQLIIISTIDDPEAQTSVGGSAAALLPREILIPSGRKLLFSYTRIQVSEGGIFAGGIVNPILRTPEVSINGITRLSATVGTPSLIASYTVNTEDLRAPLRFDWSGEAVIFASHEKTARFQFNLTGTRVGDVLKRRVAVRVTDADNLTADFEEVVSIFITPNRDDDDFPPPCRIKPWLPICNEPMARAAASAPKRNRS